MASESSRLHALHNKYCQRFFNFAREIGQQPVPSNQSGSNGYNCFFFLPSYLVGAAHSYHNKILIKWFTAHLGYFGSEFGYLTEWILHAALTIGSICSLSLLDQRQRQPTQWQSETEVEEYTNEPSDELMEARKKKKTFYKCVVMLWLNWTAVSLRENFWFGVCDSPLVLYIHCIIHEQLEAIENELRTMWFSQQPKIWNL